MAIWNVPHSINWVSFLINLSHRTLSNSDYFLLLGLLIVVTLWETRNSPCVDIFLHKLHVILLAHFKWYDLPDFCISATWRPKLCWQSFCFTFKNGPKKYFMFVHANSTQFFYFDDFILIIQFGFSLYKM